MATRERPQEEDLAEAVQDIAARLEMPLEQAKQSLTALEAQPTVTRELLMRQFAEAWLGGSQRRRGACGGLPVVVA